MMLQWHHPVEVIIRESSSDAAELSADAPVDTGPC
jgi:hypothetical protein